MAGAVRNPSGPLRYATLVRFTEGEDVAIFWDKTRMPKVEARDDDEDFLVRDFDRSDQLATTEIGSSRTAHLIMDRNETDEVPMRLWPNDFYPGRRIQIPTTEGLRDRDFV